MVKKKILVVIQLLRRGGVELVALNFAKSLDRNKYDISFLLVEPNEHQDDSLVKEVLQSGINVFEIPGNVNGYFNKYKFLKAFFQENTFDIVHSHVMFFSAFVMLAAKKCNVRVRVSHSHATKWNRKETVIFKIYKAITRFFINNYATDLLSCSVESGKYLYGSKEFKKRGQVISNGIDTEKYAFDLTVRNQKRAELSIGENEILVGHIGTIYYIKNQTFLAEVFAKMLEKNDRLKLILVGEEADGAPVREKVRCLNIEDKVIFAGQRSDVPQLLQAMDIMIFPSLFEALPVSLIEAQASGLSCLISGSVTSEVKFNDNVKFLSLDENTEVWAAAAYKLLEADRQSVSTDKLVKSYDISSVIKKLDKIYMS